MNKFAHLEPTRVVLLKSYSTCLTAAAKKAGPPFKVWRCSALVVRQRILLHKCLVSLHPGMQIGTNKPLGNPDKNVKRGVGETCYGIIAYLGGILMLLVPFNSSFHGYIWAHPATPGHFKAIPRCLSRVFLNCFAV